MRIPVLLLSLALMGIAPILAAQPKMLFVGMHGKKANIRIDRRNELLAPGERGPHNIILLSVTRERAVVGIGTSAYLLKKRSKSPVKLPSTVAIKRRQGMFFTPGEINGAATQFIVDTGASHVVLSGNEARRLGVRYTTHNSVRVQTASGSELAYRITLDSVAVSGIYLARVPALIIRGSAPRTALLGMSFLAKLRITQNSREMTLSR